MKLTFHTFRELARYWRREKAPPREVKIPRPALPPQPLLTSHEKMLRGRKGGR